MHGTTPAGRCGREKQALALLLSETAGHLSLDAIDKGLRFRESLPQQRRPVDGRGEDSVAVRREHSASERVHVATVVASGLPSRSHSRAVLSEEAVRMRPPSGANTALLTKPVWPREGSEWLAVAVP
jgi:hypothetical protein